jgi:hypothetical protein
LDALPSQWPFRFLTPENTTVIVVSDDRLQEVTHGLMEDGFFRLPEQLDPRPSADNSSFCLTLFRDEDSRRVFGRVSNDGFAPLWEVVEGFFSRAGLERDWWREGSSAPASVPGQTIPTMSQGEAPSASPSDGLP